MSFNYHTHGFELKPSNQLSRINNKMARWERYSELREQREQEREQKIKSLIKKHEKANQRVEKFQL